MSIQIRLRRWDENARSLDVVHTSDDFHMSVGVFQSISLRDFKSEPSTVSWPCIGAQEPECAMAFAALLVEAARVAWVLDGIRTWKRFEFPAGWERDESGHIVVTVDPEGLELVR